MHEGWSSSIRAVNMCWHSSGRHHWSSCLFLLAFPACATAIQTYCCGGAGRASSISNAVIGAVETAFTRWSQAQPQEGLPVIAGVHARRASGTSRTWPSARRARPRTGRRSPRRSGAQTCGRRSRSGGRGTASRSSTTPRPISARCCSRFVGGRPLLRPGFAMLGCASACGWLAAGASDG